MVGHRTSAFYSISSPLTRALAGILPRDGTHIGYKQLSHAIQHAYNLSPSLADQLTAAAAGLDQGRGWIDLHDLNALNVSSTAST